jgi:hypothetical protein
MQNSLKKAAYAVASSAVLAGAFFAGSAYAADPRLDEADAFVTKTIALLKALENPSKPGEYGGHRLKALSALDLAQKEIRAAKQYVDRPRPAPPTPPKPLKPHGPHPRPGK